MSRDPRRAGSGEGGDREGDDCGGEEAGPDDGVRPRERHKGGGGDRQEAGGGEASRRAQGHGADRYERTGDVSQCGACCMRLVPTTWYVYKPPKWSTNCRVNRITKAKYTLNFA